MNGLIIVNKQSGYTSFDIVNITRKSLGIKKVGHTGTLDPIASGVLVLCVGRYTKLGELLGSLDKEYIAEIKLGINTDTLDITGVVTENKKYSITKEDIINVFNKFTKEYLMEVPIYSAVKVNGKKLYEYARKNIDVKLPIKKVQIYSLELLDFHDDIIKFKAHVSKGTYIRSLIRDICKELNTVGVMNSLVRTKQGSFKIENANTLDDIKTNRYKLYNLKEVFNICSYNLNDEEYKLVINGNKINLKIKDDLVLLVYCKEDIAIYKKENNLYKCYVMLKVN